MHRLPRHQHLNEEDYTFILKLNVYYIEISLNKMVLQQCDESQI